MAAFGGGLRRVGACWVLFFLGVAALHALGVGAVIVSGVIAFALNRTWRAQQLERLQQQHRAEVAADEEIRSTVRAKGGDHAR